MEDAVQGPLVSILIPAYHPEFIEPCLASAIGQTYADCEIIVCDDSSNGGIESVCRQLAAENLRYVRNASRRGFAGNFTKCFGLANGEYIKFLNDDDVLNASCVADMMRPLAADADGVSMVFSKRALINETGQRYRDCAINARLAETDTRFDGRMLGNALLYHSANFIGEPTTVLFRKACLQIDGDSIFRLSGRDYHCLADVSLWLRLLSVGDAIYLCDELSAFRVHSGQEQAKPDVALKCLMERYTLLDDVRALGYLAEREVYLGAARSVLRMIDEAMQVTWCEPGAVQMLSGTRDALCRIVG